MLLASKCPFLGGIKLYFLLGSLLIILTSTEVHAEPYYRDLEELTPVQRTSLQKLKNRVSSLMPHDFMKEDLYLVNFLIAQRYDASRAETMVKAMLKWRHDSKVDTWDKDPGYFADIYDDYQMYIDGKDKTGRPVLELFFGEWDVRSAVVSGKLKHLTNLFLFHQLLANEVKVREQQALGKNITEYIIIANLEGFNLVKQGCPACLPFFVNVVLGIEQYFPNALNKIILVNTPSSFTPIIQLTRPIMSPKTRKGLKVFTSDKEQWMAYLNKHVDPSEISDWLAGTKKRKGPNKSLLE